VEIDGFDSDIGIAAVSLCGSETRFPPSEEGDTLARAFVEIRDGRAVASFHDLPYGDYAVAVFHDKNGDQQLNTNFLGMPTEPYGFSNDSRRRFRAPRFDEASVRLASEELVIGVTLE
jgi:uncharacterized protein (DUF2141 family)